MEITTGCVNIKQGLKRKIIFEGNKGVKPRFWSLVNCRVIELLRVNAHSESLESSITSSSKNSPVTTELSALRIGVAKDEWFRTVETSLQLMYEGEVSEFRVQLRDGYWVVFEIHLTSVAFQPQAFPCWDIEEVMDVSQQLKESGVLLYRNKRTIDSFFLFSQALKLLLPLEILLTKKKSQSNEEDYSQSECLKDITLLVAAIYNNLAACQLLQGNYVSVVHLCNKTLDRTPSELKAIYRKIRALLGLKQYQESIEMADIGLLLDPSSKEIHKLKIEASYFCNKQEEGIIKGMKKYFS